MPALVAGIHVFTIEGKEDVDGRAQAFYKNAVL
jgi:hypothetical protein